MFVGAAADVRTRNASGLTPIAWASFNGHAHVNQWLVAHGCFDDLTGDGATSDLRVASFISSCADMPGHRDKQLTMLLAWAQVNLIGFRC